MKGTPEVMDEKVAVLARAAKKASYKMASVPPNRRNEALSHLADLLADNEKRILSANEEDMKRASTEGLSAPALARLHLDHGKIQSLVDALNALVLLPDPIGQRQIHRALSDGLVLSRVTCPIGVVGVIFESRPDALIQIGSLCLKSANCVLLKGGREAAESNRVLFSLLTEAAENAGFPAGWAGLLETREDVGAMLSLDRDIDLIIPRGSGSFVKNIMERTQIPVLGHSEGICHLYLDEKCDENMASTLAVDSKTQYPSACNAVETLLWHQNALASFLHAAEALHEHGVRIIADPRSAEALRHAGIPFEEASPESWEREYLDLIINARCVDSLEAAADHINRHGSHHTDAIVTENDESWKRFSELVDSAGVYRNCSTRFADGYRYGFGAEVGIATGKLHARGPMGLEGLCSYKYLLEGEGNTVQEFALGRKGFLHRDLPC